MVAADTTARYGDHDWKPNNFPWPFWVVTRVESATGANCGFKDLTVNVVSTGSGADVIDEAVVEACAVTLPVLTNVVDLKAGDILVAQWQGYAPKRPPETKVKVATWHSQAAKKQRV